MLLALLVLAFAVSIVHYVDNVVGYDAYPQSTTLPNPTPGLIAASWFLFTASGVAALVLLRRARLAAGALCLAGYSASGVVGIGHYLVPGATDMVWWRQAHLLADIALGLGLLGSALWLTRRQASGRSRRAVGAGPRRSA